MNKTSHFHGASRRIHGADIVIASHNHGKIAEFSDLLLPLNARLQSAAALGLPEPEETGQSFTANAEIKALATAKASGMIALADDSGLEVMALGGEPGIYSARWAGPHRDFKLAMARVEDGLRGQDDRRARFISVLALAWPDGYVTFFEGTVEGKLVWPPRGAKGFGYDPMFLPDGYALTFGEMSAEEKAKISHRARACAALVARMG